MTTFIPKITKLSGRIIRILGCNPGPMTLQGTNTYLIGTGRSRLLFDTGELGVPEYIEQLRMVLKTEDIQIEGIIISHWHRDHTGGIADVKRLIDKADCPVYKFKSIDPPDEKGFNFLHNNEVLSTKGATVRVIHTPGHTSDHICLFMEEEKCLFSGDCILGEGSSVFEDLHSYMASLEKIKNLLPKVLYPGHGPVVEDPVAKIEEYIAHRNEREKQILEAIINSRKSISIDEIVSKVYKETPEALLKAAAGNVLHHVQKLKKDGKLKETEAGGVMARYITNNI